MEKWQHKEAYLGDGLYAGDDGIQIRLFCAREGGSHEVYLEGEVLHAFLKFIERAREVQISVNGKPI